MALLALVSACQSDTPDPLAEACRDVSCGAGRCALIESGPACLCDPGHHADGLRCVEDPPPPDPDPCEPNPCTEPHRTVCTAEGTTYQCGCDAGYLWQDGQCVELTRPTCASEPWPGGDAFEPDDCPERAILDFPMGQPQEGRTLAPVGDVDWYRLQVQAGNTYRVVAEGAEGLPLYLDVLTSDTLQPVMADHRGQLRVEVHFKATSATPVLVRLSTFVPTAQGSYTLTLHEERQDDFSDTDEGAAALPAGGVVVSGNLDFHGDVDVHALTLDASSAAIIDAVSSPVSATELRLELVAPDGTVVREERSTQVRLHLRVPVSGRYLLRVRGSSPTTTGNYRLAFQRLGPDDHGDDAASATSISPSSSPVAGTLERSLDVDAFTFTPVAGHQYSVRCVSTTGSFQCGKVLFRQGEEPTGFWDTFDLRVKATDATPLVLLVNAYWGEQGAYAVHVVDLGADDHPDGTTNGTPMTAGGPPVTGSLVVETDVDAFTFTAQALHIYRFQCTTQISWLGFTLRDPAGASVGQGATATQTFVFVTRVDGLHTVQVRPYFSSLPGNYSCQLTNQGLDDHGNTQVDASPLQAGEGAGEHQYDGDVDVFSAQTVLGTLYRVTLTPGSARGLGMFVLSASGGPLANVAAHDAPRAVSFKATTPTTAFVVSSNTFPSTTGTWSLRLEEAGADDHGDTPATATAVAVPGTFAGTFDFAADVDVFSFPATSGRIYRVHCPAVSGSITPTLTAYEGSRPPYGEQGTLRYEARTSGTLAVAVSNGSQAYACTVEDAGTDDHPDTAEGASELPVPASGTGMTETYGDVDAFTFRPTEGRVYRFTCSRSGCTVRLRGPDGKLLAEKPYTWNNTTSLSWEATGLEWVSVEVEAWTGTPYDYALEDVGTDDHGDTSLEATALGVGTVGASFESFGDVDAYSFTATAGRVYRVRCVASTATWCSLKVKDPTDHEVPASHEAVVGGRYVVEVSTGSNETGTYTLHVEDLGLDDHADTAAGATPLPAGNTPMAGHLETFTDVDVFALSVTSGRAYRIACASPPQTFLSCNLVVRAASGAQVASTNGFPNTLSFEAPATGTMTLEVSSASSQTTSTYTLTLEDLGLDDAGDTVATATPLTLSRTVSGRLETATDVDVYAMQLTGEQRYLVTVSSNARFQLRVLTANGTVIPLDFTREFRPTTSGTYYLQLVASEAGSYQLQVQTTF
ncbi:hypothetical protein ACLESO_10490 [Pyxidicoccus sp. 3LG]